MARLTRRRQDLLAEEQADNEVIGEAAAEEEVCEEEEETEEPPAKKRKKRYGPDYHAFGEATRSKKRFRIDDFMREIIANLGPVYAASTLKLNPDLVKYVLEHELPELADRQRCASCKTCNHCNAVQTELEEEFVQKKGDLASMEVTHFPV